MDVIENWLPVPGYEKYIEISDFGRARTINRPTDRINAMSGNPSGYIVKGRMLKLSDNGRGYKYISVRLNKARVRFYIHRAVALAFLDNDLNLPDVNHKDGIKSNNILSNLEWISRIDNVQHALETGLWKNKSRFNPGSKKVINIVTQEMFHSGKDAARFAGINYGTFKDGLRLNKVYKNYKYFVEGDRNYDL